MTELLQNSALGYEMHWGLCSNLMKKMNFELEKCLNIIKYTKTHLQFDEKKLTLNLRSVWISSSTQKPTYNLMKKINFELEKCLNIIKYTKPPTYNLMKKINCELEKCLTIIKYTKPTYNLMKKNWLRTWKVFEYHLLYKTHLQFDEKKLTLNSKSVCISSTIKKPTYNLMKND